MKKKARKKLLRALDRGETVTLYEGRDPLVVVVPWDRWRLFQQQLHRQADALTTDPEQVALRAVGADDNTFLHGPPQNPLEEVLASAETSGCEDSSLLAWGSALMLDDEEKADFEAWWKERHAQVGPTAENLWGQGDMEMPTSGQATQ